ncbi:MAG: arginine--tRNA ligase, partial [Planctomycetota bacterium]|nr:arginine--tRNA ligase [Planctomycetota bacterium]
IYMKSIKQEIIDSIIEQTGLPEEYVCACLEKSARPEWGDYSLACFRLSKTLGKSPDTIAKEIASRIKSTDLIEKVQPVTGYVNIFLSSTKLVEIALKEGIQIPDYGNGKRIVIDYSSPNIAKPFSIGHLRSTVIGNALSKIYTELGYKCIGINFLGDWGVQFGHILDGIKREDDSVLTVDMTKPSDQQPLITFVNKKTGRDLNKYYVISTSANDPAGREWAREVFGMLESGDDRIRCFWEIARKKSIEEFDHIYELLGINFHTDDNRYGGESEITPADINNAVAEMDKKGLTRISDGALIVDLERYGMPTCLLRKSDGATLYAARDVAAAIARYNTYKFSKMLYVVGADQKLHFRQVFKVLELMGYSWAKDCVHIDFGLVRFKSDQGREKMSTRRGTTILLEDVLNEAIKRSQALMKERVPEMADKVSPSEASEVARAVGIGAVIFNDLKNKRIKDVDFNWEQILTFDGETGPYLQYTHTRLDSLIRKYDTAKGLSRPEPDYKLLTASEEISIIKEMIQFPDIVKQSADEYEPSILSNYLLNLAGLFNRYYQIHRIISDDENLSSTRICLVARLKEVLKKGMGFLGITPLEKM